MDVVVEFGVPGDVPAEGSAAVNDVPGTDVDEEVVCWAADPPPGSSRVARNTTVMAAMVTTTKPAIAQTAVVWPDPVARGGGSGASGAPQVVQACCPETI